MRLIMRSVMFICESFCLSFCDSVISITCKSNEPILLKLDVMIGPTSPKNWLTFGGDKKVKVKGKCIYIARFL